MKNEELPPPTQANATIETPSSPSPDSYRKTSASAPTTDALTRMWEHALHEEKIYNERHNFFLVAEAMLFVSYATLPSNALRVLIIICTLGLLLTVMWMVIARRQAADLHIATKRLEEHCTEYAEFKKQRSKIKGFRKVGIWVLDIGVPVAIGVTWILLILEIFGR